MKAEKTLKLASYFLKFLMLIQIIFCLGFAFIYFHSLNSPENYEILTIDEKNNLMFNFDVIKTPKTYTEWKESEQLTHYILLDGYSKFYIIWFMILNFLGFFIILFLLNRFLKNTKNFNLFFESNIKTLNKIILILSSLFLMNFMDKGFTLKPMSMIFENNIYHFITKKSDSLDFLIYYPLTIIFFFVLREVFKRGRELKQENDLTI
jgi:hypothetical protein